MLIWYIADRPMTFDPFNEALSINIDAGTDANEAGLKAVGFAVVYPPADGLFTKSRKSRHQLVDRQNVLAIHEPTLSMFVLVTHPYGCRLKWGAERR